MVVRVCAGGQPQARRLRGDRERRPRRLGGRARCAEGVRAVLPREGAGARRDPFRLMAIEYVGSATERARTRARRAAYAHELSFLRRVDWLLTVAVAGLVGYGLWAINGITHHDVEGNAHYFLVRQAMFAGVGVVGF